jgi:hypothetical protein
MPTPVTPELIQEVAYAATTDVLNRGEAMAIDRQAMPLLDTLWKNRATDAGNAGSKTRINWKTAGEIAGQYWNRRDKLSFQENKIDLYGEAEFTNLHFGLEFVHTDLLDMGYSVIYNDSRNAKFAKKVPADEVNRLVDIFEEKVETHLDNIKVFLDRELVRDGSHATNALVGLDALVSPSAVTGSIHGKSRATNPILRHVVKTGLTTGVGGNLYQSMVQGMRQAMLYSRGQGGRKYVFVCGSKYLDAYTSIWYANAALSNVRHQAGGKIDGAISDDSAAFMGKALVWNPTFDAMQAAGIADNGIPWDKRCYAIDTSAIEIRSPSKMDMQTSFPADPGDQRFTRMSVDMRLTMVNKNPNAHALFAIA